MCGIWGTLRLGQSSPPIDQELFLSSLKRIRHRGPDFLGHHFHDRFAFGHARLSILDLDPRSHQPMKSSDEKVILTYNGEIYNFHQIREQLSKEGLRFHTTSDTEVILKAYQAWGLHRFIEKAEGMFAFSLMDLEKNKLYLVRDRLGKKPLFYHSSDKCFFFSSEISPLHHYLGHLEINPEGLNTYLNLNFSPYSSHLYKGVFAVPPAHYIDFDLDSLEMTFIRYWQPFQGQRSSNYSVDELEETLQSAVEKRLIADVPVCGFLSGGVDSSLIASFASHKQKNFRSYCIGYEGQEKYNENEYAQLVADKFKLDHHEVTISLAESKKTLLEIGSLLDEPISNWVWVPLYHLSKRVKDDAYKVVLVGEGADELFHGYNSYDKALKNIQKTSRLKSLMGDALIGWAAKHTNQGHKSFDHWRRTKGDGPLYMGTSLNFPQTLLSQVTGKNSSSNTIADKYISDLHLDLKKFSQEQYDHVDLIAYTEIYAKMIEVLVRRVDRITMLNSIEARAPFLDHKLIELVFKTMGQNRIDQGTKKAWLKKVASRHIPHECINRKKMGFSFPFSAWLHGELGKTIEEKFIESAIFQDEWLNKDYALSILRDHQAHKRDYAPKIWSLYTLAAWYDHWIKR